MKRFFLFATAFLLMVSCGQKQRVTDSEEIEDVPEEVIPPVSQIEVELLNKEIDLNMDISQLSLSDLYILRHAFAARKGYPFRDGLLRHIYESTTWYDSLMYDFDSCEELFHFVQDNPNDSYRDSYYKAIKDDAVVLTEAEQAFVDRIKAREEELLKENFKTIVGYRVNLKNLMNPMQLKTMDKRLAARLGRNGFAIVPAKHQQLFHVYEQNDYHDFPSFVTTDLFLQLYHLYFDSMLREVEQFQFYNKLHRFCQLAQTTLQSWPVNGIEMKETKEWLVTYFVVANALLNQQQPAGNSAALHEYQQVLKSENDFSAYLGYTEVKFEYGLFRPRGHYTRNDSLKSYFRAMMWLQTVPFQTDHKSDMQKAIMLADVVGGNDQLMKLYTALNEPLTYLMGQPDDVSIAQVWKLKQTETDFDRLCKKIDQLAEHQTRLRPKHAVTSRNKVRLMPQRYQPDAEVMQEMVDYKSQPTLRATPKGLDFMAAMGNSLAEQILLEELKEGEQWKEYVPTLTQMKQRMQDVDWEENLAVKWMQTLHQSTVQEKVQPYFMVTPEWGRKQLNTVLASWAELKHDAILYAKQPMGAECGAGGPPAPVVKGYVEPNVAFWQRAVDLIAATGKVFATYGLQTERLSAITTNLMEKATFLLNVSKKELAGQQLSDEENDQIEYIGAAYENMSLELIRDPNQYLWMWSDVQGPERNVALIADVYTANAANNPEKSILYEAVGMADEIYVVVEIQGRLYLMRGGVLSYRELLRPYGEQRMNDEEWQKKLETAPRLGVPVWMKPIIVPLDKAPVHNEEVFYSSGC